MRGLFSMSLFFSVFTTIFAQEGVTFTGNAEIDFTATNLDAVYLEDGTSADVYVPSAFGEAVISGWDIQGIYAAYSASEDVLYIGLKYFGIAGDADGNGDPSHTSQILDDRFGTDFENLSQSESIMVGIDLNEDNISDIYAGIASRSSKCGSGSRSHSLSQFQLSYNNSGDNRSIKSGGCQVVAVPSYFYGMPNTDSPDFEFAIYEFSSLLKDYPESNSIGLIAFSGSFQDDGIGEDAVPNFSGLRNIRHHILPFIF